MNAFIDRKFLSIKRGRENAPSPNYKAPKADGLRAKILGEILKMHFKIFKLIFLN